jgi:hypothetical protein
MGTNTSTHSNSMLSCKRHRFEKDLVCHLNSLSSPTTITPQLSYHQFEPMKLEHLKIRKTAGINPTCSFEMSVHNPNKHFFLPESLTVADEQLISGKTRRGICSREWKCGEKDLFSNGRETLMVCSNAFHADVSYADEDKLTLRGMSAKTTTSTYLGRNLMQLEASTALEPSDIPKHDFCSSQECTWANITMPIRAVSYRWERGSIWCDPSICEAIGTLVPMAADEQ